MRIKVFSVFDSKLASFGRPWYEMTEASAVRVFSDAVNDSTNANNQWYKHPEDFSLYLLGEFDDSSGEITSERPLSLVTASSLFNYIANGPPDNSDTVLKNGSKKTPQIV